MTFTYTEISHARRRRRGRAKPKSSTRAAAPSRPAQSTRAPHDRAREVAPASAMGGVATLHASFAELGIPEPLVSALARAGLTVSFPIQAATLPDALAGRDILGRGRTGSGKTLGLSIPLVAGLADGFTSAGRPRGLVLVPTRELASPATGPRRGGHVRQLPGAPQAVETRPAALSPGPDARNTPGAWEHTGHKMALSREVVVDVCDREDARISAMGVLPSGCGIPPPVAGNQQLIRAKGTDPGSS